ncbi:MAG: ABC transporter permease [Candidatus Bipolaricaulota bacterium]
MFAYTVRRLGQMLLVLLGLSILLFLLLKLAPGDSAQIMAGLGATPEVVQNLRVKLGLDKPWHVQYWKLFSGLFTGELEAVTFHTTVINIVAERLPATVELGFFGLLFAIFISIPAGIISAVRKGSMADYVVTTVALLGVSTPVFWTALMLMIVFSLQLDLLPVSGRGATMWGWSFLTVDGLLHMIIPALALSSVMMAMNARLTRSSMLEVLSEDYITTARSKGIRERVVIFIHAFRNAILPVLTNVGMQVGALVAGAVLTETTTAWPGVGRLMIEAINRRDMGLVFGLSLFIAMFYLLSYLIVDLLYAYVDPRITYD